MHFIFDAVGNRPAGYSCKMSRRSGCPWAIVGFWSLGRGRIRRARSNLSWDI